MSKVKRLAPVLSSLLFVGGFWYVVSEVEYSCPDGSRELVTSSRVLRQSKRIRLLVEETVAD